jgi:hypothetical protein
MAKAIAPLLVPVGIGDNPTAESKDPNRAVLASCPEHGDVHVVVTRVHDLSPERSKPLSIGVLDPLEELVGRIARLTLLWGDAVQLVQLLGPSGAPLGDVPDPCANGRHRRHRGLGLADPSECGVCLPVRTKDWANDDPPLDISDGRTDDVDGRATVNRRRHDRAEFGFQQRTAQAAPSGCLSKPRTHAQHSVVD